MSQDYIGLSCTLPLVWKELERKLRGLTVIIVNYKQDPCLVESHEFFCPLCKPFSNVHTGSIVFVIRLSQDPRVHSLRVARAHNERRLSIQVTDEKRGNLRDGRAFDVFWQLVSPCHLVEQLHFIGIDSKYVIVDTAFPDEDGLCARRIQSASLVRLIKLTDLLSLTAIYVNYTRRLLIVAAWENKSKVFKSRGASEHSDIELPCCFNLSVKQAYRLTKARIGIEAVRVYHGL